DAPDGRIAIEMSVRGAAGEPLVVRVRDLEVASTSALAPAKGRGIDDALLADKLGALGGTPFTLARLDTAALAPGLHLAVWELKDVRRRLVAALEPAVLARPRTVRTGVIEALRVRIPDSADTVPLIVPLVRDDAQLDAVLELGVPEVELDWMELVGLGRA